MDQKAKKIKKPAAGTLFTVFTPTYNSRETLCRVYESLASQTYTDFEWLIVDDGSTDGTADVVKDWKHRAPFPIRYRYQKNSGKHRAFNRAVKEADGSLFICLDADDACAPKALEKFYDSWHSIPEAEREAFSGVTVHCMDPSGKIVGDRFPTYCMDLMPVEMNARYGIRGEKWGFHRTDILRRFPFPEIEGERFIPEGVVWNRIGAAFKMRYVDEILRVYYPTPFGLTVQSRRLRVSSPKGARLYYKEALGMYSRHPTRIQLLLNYIAFSLHAGIRPPKICSESGAYYATLALLPFGCLVYLLDKRDSSTSPKRAHQR